MRWLKAGLPPLYGDVFSLSSLFPSSDAPGGSRVKVAAGAPPSASLLSFFSLPFFLSGRDFLDWA